MRQALFDHRGETELGLLACAPGAITAGDLGAVAVAVRRHAVVDQGDARRAQGDGVGITGGRIQRHRRHQQAQGPDGAAMGVHPARDAPHRRFAFAADAAEGFAQRLTDFADVQRGVRHLPEAGPEGQRRGVHQAQAQVAVGAAATTVHQRRFGREVGFIDQGVHRQVRQPVGQGQVGIA
ncbi:hypothetical protein D9M68_771080 [compost metagenome]